MNHNIPGQTPESGNRKQVIAFGLFFAIIGTVLFAMQHNLPWTIGGLLLVGLDIFLLTGDKNG